MVSVFFTNYRVSPIQRGTTPYVEVTYDVRRSGRHRAYPDRAYPVHRRKATVRAYPEADGWQIVITNLDNVPSGSAPKAANNSEVFADLSSVYQSGKTYPLPIRSDRIRPPISLMLYRAGEPVEDLSSLITSGDFLWRVSRQTKPGKNYRLRLYNPLTGETTESESFAIRRKPLWPFIVAGVGAVGIFYLIKSISNEVESSNSNARLLPLGR